MVERISCVVLLLLLTSFPGYSQPAGPLRNLVFHELTQKDGLSELRNSYLTMDSRGFVWIGGYDGLDRFDGKNVKPFHPMLTNGQPDPNTSSRVFEDKAGKLWFSTYNSLHCIDPITDKMVPVELKSVRKNLPDDYYAFHLDTDDNLWLVAGDSLRLYNVFTKAEKTLHPLKAYACTAILNADGKVTAVAVSKPDGPFGMDIYSYADNKVFKKDSYFEGKDRIGLPNNYIIETRAEGDSILWLFSRVGLIRFPLLHPADYRIFELNDKGKAASIRDAIAWKNCQWATSTSGGLCLFDEQGNVQLHTTNAWVKNRTVDLSLLNNVLVDQQENLWLTAWGKGVYYTNLRHSKFQHLFQPTLNQPNKNRQVENIAEDKHHNLWCILPEEGLVVLDEQLRQIRAYSKIVPTNGPPSKGNFNSVQTDADGNTWVQVGSDIYFAEKPEGPFRRIGKKLDTIIELVQVAPDRYFLLTLTNLFEFSKKGREVIDFKQAKPLAIFDRNYKLLWNKKDLLFITNGFNTVSVYKIKEHGVSFVKHLSDMGGVNGIAISTDKQHVWFASNKGLFKMENNTPNATPVLVKGPKNQLARSFNAILQDNAGNLWLSSNTGIFKYDPDGNTVKHYTESDGLQGMQFNLASACGLSDGRMAFGGMNGMNIFHPDSVRDDTVPPILHFTDLVVNDTGSVGSNLASFNNRSFPYEENTLTFHFIGIDFTAPEEVQYKYWIKGYDQDTVFGGTSSSARYAKLPAKDYVFQVWAANSDGVWTKEAKEVHFTIRPPWWATWWARTLQIAALLALIYAYYRFRVNQIRKKEEMRRMEAEFKQKEAEIKQQMSETETAILRLQMNPHFIFNSMNSISSYIHKKDIATANDYLSRFAKLMRMILNLAAKPRIFIADEIELLELYINTEAMRFEKKFSYEVTVDDALDPEEILVPTMILQPFVENAIWHGLAGKGEAGRIQIRFEKQDNQLVCSVEDNGRGRPAEGTKKPGGHESKALGITARRLSLLEEETGVKSFYEIIDLKTADGEPAGTRVEVHLPLMDE